MTPFPSFLSCYFQSPSIGRHRPRCIHSFTTLTDMAVSPIQIPTRRPPRLYECTQLPSFSSYFHSPSTQMDCCCCGGWIRPSLGRPLYEGHASMAVRRYKTDMPRQGTAEQKRDGDGDGPRQAEEAKNEQLRWQLEIVSGTTRGSHWWSIHNRRRESVWHGGGGGSR